MLRIHQGGVVRAPTVTDNIAAIANKSVVYVPEKNCRYPSREAKHQRNQTEGLPQLCWCIGLAGGEDLTCNKDLPWRQKKLASISHFQDYPIIPRTFI